jgi:hypothetical protein
MAYYDGDGTYSFSFIVDMSNGDRTFRVKQDGTEAPDTPDEPETEPDTEPVDPAQPVYIAGPADLADVATSSGVGIAGAEVKNEHGIEFVSITVNTGDPQFVVGENLGTLPNYLAIVYRTTAEEDAEMFIGTANGPNGKNDHVVLPLIKDGHWHLLLVDLTSVQNIIEGNIGYFRLDPFRGQTEASLDVACIGFFNTAEYAENYYKENYRPKAWDSDEGKAIVTHRSFDALPVIVDGNEQNTIFAPGASSSWDKVATIDSTVDALRYWGWVGVKGDLGEFGYSIDGGAYVFSADFAVPPDQAVIDAAKNGGADNASRVGINVPMADLDGEHTVTIVYKNTDGYLIELLEYTVIRMNADQNGTMDQ